MSYLTKFDTLKRKIDETKAYIAVSNGLAAKKRARASLAANEALQGATECIESTQSIITDLRHICEAQVKSIEACRRKPEVRI